MLEGIIIFKQANVGSKSEMLAPYLYKGNGEFERIKMLGENPFMRSSLYDYDGVRVTLTGEYNDDGVFMIESVQAVE